MSIEVIFDKIVANGAGLGRLDDGTVVFCDGALPAERVRIDITERRKDFVRGQLVEVLEPSPHRAQPPCPHVEEGCGGCTWQHVADPIALKVDIVSDALRRLAHLDPPIAAAPETVGLHRYRTTLDLNVVDGRAGYHGRQSHEPLTVDSCLVAHEALEDLVVHGRFPGARRAFLRVSAATGERLAIPDGGSAQVAGDVRTDSIEEVVAGRRWRVTGRAFFQPGPGPAEVLTAAVRRAVGPPPTRLLDLYAGVGLLGGAIAAAAGNVTLTAVESNPVSARDAAHNLRDLGARVRTGDVATTPGGRADAVIADPARPGLAKPGVEAVLGAHAPIVVLVSCDPASMARDAALLTGRGYRLEQVEVVDLFPGTFHVEAVSRFVAEG